MQSRPHTAEEARLSDPRISQFLMAATYAVGATGYFALSALATEQLSDDGELSNGSKHQPVGPRVCNNNGTAANWTERFWGR